MRRATLLLCGMFAALAAAQTQIRIDVWYPAQNLPSGAVWSIAGTEPLAWDNPWGPLTSAGRDHWVAEFTVPSTIVNASQPTWELAFKVLVNKQYEMGANHRIAFDYKTTSVNKTIYPYFNTATGAEFTIKNVFSPQLNNTRDVWIFAPPAMVENPYFVAERTMIMQDGQNLSPLWNVPQHLNKLWADEAIEQIFIIGPYNTPERIAEYTYSKSKYYGGGKGDLYLDWVEQTLIPTVAKQYSFLKGQQNLGMGGSSLGGLISCYAGVTRPKVFGTMVCMSSSFWWNNGDFHGTIVPQLTRAHGETQRYYMDSGDSGDSDDDMLDTTLVTTSFISKDVGFIMGRNLFWYMQRGGQHNEYWWSLRFHHPMQYLFQRPAVWNWIYNN